MKKLLITILALTMLTGCAVQPTVVGETSMTSETMISSESDKIEQTSSNKIMDANKCITPKNTNTLETTTTLLPYEMSKKELLIILQALVDKNKDELWRIGYEYDKGNYLNNVDFTSFKLIDSVSYQRDDAAHISQYSVELDISESTDKRFPVGKSSWNMGFIDNNVWYILPEDYEAPYLNENIKEDNKVKLCFMYSFAFPFESIEDVSKVRNLYEETEYLSYLQMFVLGISPEFKSETGYNYSPYGEYSYSAEQINRIARIYLGIENAVNNDFDGFQGTLGDYISISDAVILNEKTDTYIDITFFSDRVYLCPAKKNALLF